MRLRPAIVKLQPMVGFHEIVVEFNFKVFSHGREIVKVEVMVPFGPYSFHKVGEDGPFHF